MADAGNGTAEKTQDTTQGYESQDPEQNVSHEFQQKVLHYWFLAKVVATERWSKGSYKFWPTVPGLWTLSWRHGLGKVQGGWVAGTWIQPVICARPESLTSYRDVSEDNQLHHVY